MVIPRVKLILNFLFKISFTKGLTGTKARSGGNSFLTVRYMNSANFKTKIMIKQQKLNEKFCVGDVLVSDIFKDLENFPRIFRTHKVDNDFGVVYYRYKGKEDTIGTAYIRRAKFLERMFAWMTN